MNGWCHPRRTDLAGPCWKLLAAGIFRSYHHYPALGSRPANVSRHSFIMFSSAHPSVGQIHRIIQCYAESEQITLCGAESVLMTSAYKYPMRQPN